MRQNTQRHMAALQQCHERWMIRMVSQQREQHVHDFAVCANPTSAGSEILQISTRVHACSHSGAAIMLAHRFHGRCTRTLTRNKGIQRVCYA